MHDPWFFAPDLAGDAVQLDEAESRHAAGSRRLRPGDRIALFDGRGGVAEGLVADAAPRRGKRPPATTVRIAQRRAVAAPGHALTLATATPKGPRLDYLVEKCTELGVARIALTAWERSIARPSETQIERLRRLALEACKQCRRAWLPAITLAPPPPPETPALLVASPDPAAPSLTAWLTGGGAPPAATIVIGPEGGLGPGEQAALTACGATAVRLGRHVLRIETAAVAAAAVWASATAGHAEDRGPGSR